MRDSKKKPIIIAVLAVVIILVIGLIIWMKSKPSNEAETESSQEASAEEIMESTEIVEEQESTEIQKEETETAEETKENASVPTMGQDLIEPPVFVVKPTESENQSQSVQRLSLPYQIPDTSLLIQNLGSYNGIYLEDGSDSNIGSVAAIVVRNTGSLPIEYAEVLVQSAEGTNRFTLTDLLPGAVLVAQEADKTGIFGGDILSCSATVAEVPSLGMSEDKVSVTEGTGSSLIVKNLTDADIPCVRVFYKFYMADDDAFVGGITYTAKIEGLPAGGSQIVRPSHYSAGDSRVVMVRTYDTAD